MTQPKLKNLDKISFADNPAIKTRADKYVTVKVDTGRILQSWRESLFSYEWMDKNGQIKDASGLSRSELEKRAEIEALMTAGGPIEKPVLGIGLLENVEIGIGRATFLTLAANGLKEIPVHISKANQAEFASFIVS